MAHLDMTNDTPDVMTLYSSSGTGSIKSIMANNLIDVTNETGGLADGVEDVHVGASHPVTFAFILVAVCVFGSSARKLHSMVSDVCLVLMEIVFALALAFDLGYFVARTEFLWLVDRRAASGWAFRCRPDNKKAMDAKVIKCGLQTFASYVGPAISLCEWLGCTNRRSVLTSRFIMQYVSLYRVEEAHVYGEGACMVGEFPNYLCQLELPDLLNGRSCQRINFYSPDDELLSRFSRHPNGTWILDEGSPGRSQFTGEALAVLQRKRAVRIFDHGWHLIPKALKHRPGVRRPVL